MVCIDFNQGLDVLDAEDMLSIGRCWPRFLVRSEFLS